MRTFISYGIIVMGMALLMLAVQAFADATLSDLKISCVSKTMEGDAATKVTYTFMTNEKPTNVIVGLCRQAPIIDVRREFSSKKGELQVNVTQKGSGYEVIATQELLDASREPSGSEVEVWVTSGDESSNKVIRTMPQSY
jgi:hypothetical protein